MIKRARILDLGFEEKVIISFKPANFSIEGQKELFVGVEESVKEYARKLIADGWRFYACDQKAGVCYESHKMIVIPMYVIDPNHKWYAKSKKGYKCYYIAHEMAHAYAGCINNHNQVFMEWLKKICPKEYWDYELEYKPRNATKAGIGEVDPNEWLEL